MTAAAPGWRYAIRVAVVYAVMLVFGLLCVLVAGLRLVASEWAVLALLILPCVAAALVFPSVLARSPWLRESRPLRAVMVVAGSFTLWLLYLFMYGAYSQGITELVLRFRGKP